MQRTCQEHDSQKRWQSSLEDLSARQTACGDTPHAGGDGAEKQRKRNGRDDERQELVKVPTHSQAFKRRANAVETKADRDR